MDSARADKWLWAVRLFKTRVIAAEMCAAGKVKRHGHVLKAATSLRVGDVLEIPFPDGPAARTVEIILLIEKRVGAVDARACYRDATSQVALNAQLLWHQARSEGVRGRPTKKDRRDMNRIRGFFE